MKTLALAILLFAAGYVFFEGMAQRIDPVVGLVLSCAIIIGAGVLGWWDLGRPIQ